MRSSEPVFRKRTVTGNVRLPTARSRRRLSERNFPHFFLALSSKAAGVRRAAGHADAPETVNWGAVVVDQPAAPAPVVRGCSIAPASGRVLSTRVAGCVPAGERARSNGAARPANVRHARRNPRRDRMAIYEGGGEAPAGSHKKAAGDEVRWDDAIPGRGEQGGELGSRARNEGSADCLVPALCRRSIRPSLDPKYVFKGQTTKEPIEVSPGPNNLQFQGSVVTSDGGAARLSGTRRYARVDRDGRGDARVPSTVGAAP